MPVKTYPVFLPYTFTVSYLRIFQMISRFTEFIDNKKSLLRWGRGVTLRPGQGEGYPLSWLGDLRTRYHYSSPPLCCLQNIFRDFRSCHFCVSRDHLWKYTIKRSLVLLQSALHFVYRQVFSIQLIQGLS